jgi:hypothetical protein
MGRVTNNISITSSSSSISSSSSSDREGQTPGLEEDLEDDDSGIFIYIYI